jgi:4-amino-4-deoxy-L-arabinose transferase-like glycosyltransferase
LAEGHGLRDFGAVELTLYPPGLPGVVAVAHWLSLSAEPTVRLLNAAAFACTVWLGFLLLRRLVRSRLLVIGATALLGVSPLLLSMAQMVWTEPIFIVISLCLILVLERLMCSKGGILWLVFAAALVWLAFMFRYVGIVSIAAGGVTLLVGRMRHGWREALARAGCFVVMSAIVPLVRIVRNRGTEGTYLGPRPPSSDEGKAIACNLRT